MMSRRPELYRMLKNTGRPLTHTYMEYTIAQLEHELKLAGIEIPPQAEPVAPAPVEPDNDTQMHAEEHSPVTNVPFELPKSDSLPVATPTAPHGPADPTELPGQRLNTKTEDDVIRIDEQGRHWLQEEVRKPAYPKPRGRRVLKYLERGVRKETVQNGEYIETFEVAGENTPHPAEVKITLPSYQVGIYRDPRFPFKIHCYNGREGFNMFEVQDYYGGAELVPDSCKRVYIENDLCYDVRSVIRTIQNEHRALQLAGRIA